MHEKNRKVFRKIVEAGRAGHISKGGETDMKSGEPLLSVDDVKGLHSAECGLTLGDHEERSHVMWKLGFTLLQALLCFGFDLVEEGFQLAFHRPSVGTLVDWHDKAMVFAQHFSYRDWIRF